MQSEPDSQHEGNIGKVPKNGNPPGFQSFNDRLLNGVLRFTGEVEDEIWILGIGDRARYGLRSVPGDPCNILYLFLCCSFFGGS